MGQLEDSKIEAEIANLHAETARAVAETAKIEEERVSSRESWRDWAVEVIKVSSALVLGAGGVMAAITGYQLSELKKEQMDWKAEIAKRQLDDINAQKVLAEQAIASAHAQLIDLQSALAKAPQTSAGVDAISRAQSIGSELSTVAAQLKASNKSTPVIRQSSDYLVGVQTIGFDDPVRIELNHKLQVAGYGLHESSGSYSSDPAPSWAAKKSTVLYYSNTSESAANALASVLKNLTAKDFIVQRGSGLGVDPAQKDVTLFVHYRND